jgi:hypothetical protein
MILAAVLMLLRLRAKITSLQMFQQTTCLSRTSSTPMTNAHPNNNHPQPIAVGRHTTVDARVAAAAAKDARTDQVGPTLPDQDLPRPVK